MSSGVDLGFDSHAHLHFECFDRDLDQVLIRAAKNGITHVMVPSVDLPTAVKSSRISERSNCFAAAAFHPEHLPLHHREDQWHGMLRVLMHHSVVAIGETGLDLHHNTFPEQVQREWFRKHIELAGKIGYPLIVHSRDAESAVLEELPDSPAFPVILHCWGGGEEETRIAVERGFRLGFGGPLTYRKNDSLRKVASSVPGHLLLVETDSPFLPPEPFRGKRNEPARAALVVHAMRELRGKGLSIDGMSHSLWENAMRAFLLHPENRRADIVYTLGDSAYVNLTSRCNNDCTFCVRRKADGVGGYFLRHREDPSEEMVLSTLDTFPLEDFRETVFCGFGEPTLRSDLLVRCARQLSMRGITTRLNTNGLCTSFLSEDAAEELAASVDSLAVSLNASGAAEYNRLSRPSSPDSWEHLMRFLRIAGRSGKKTVLSVVKGSGVDVPRASALAERLGFPLRIRRG